MHALPQTLNKNSEEHLAFCCIWNGSLPLPQLTQWENYLLSLSLGLASQCVASRGFVFIRREGWAWALSHDSREACYSSFFLACKDRATFCESGLSEPFCQPNVKISLTSWQIRSFQTSCKPKEILLHYGIKRLALLAEFGKEPSYNPVFLQWKVCSFVCQWLLQLVEPDSAWSWRQHVHLQQPDLQILQGRINLISFILC